MTSILSSLWPRWIIAFVIINTVLTHVDELVNEKELYGSIESIEEDDESFDHDEL